MFGYVTINKPELKVKDYEKYHAYYCGLCHTLKDRHGRRGQITLTYDMTFLVILLTSLYEVKTTSSKHLCIVHPVKKHQMIQNEVTEYAADMNVALSYFHFLDDKEDEKKIQGTVLELAYRRKYKKIEKKYPRQCKAIEQCMQRQKELEELNEQDVHKICEPFADLMSELMLFRVDAFEKTLRKLGASLGSFIYLMDAYMDLQDDIKNNCYNVFRQEKQGEAFEQRVHEILVLYMADTAKEFEKLPCEWDVTILRNILYEGVWGKYERKRKL